MGNTHHAQSEPFPVAIFIDNLKKVRFKSPSTKMGSSCPYSYPTVVFSELALKSKGKRRNSCAAAVLWDGRHTAHLSDVIFNLFQPTCFLPHFNLYNTTQH